LEPKQGPDKIFAFTWDSGWLAADRACDVFCAPTLPPVWRNGRPTGLKILFFAISRPFFVFLVRIREADADTTIEELYAWEVNGPFLRDFADHKIAGARWDAGAIEFQ